MLTHSSTSPSPQPQLARRETDAAQNAAPPASIRDPERSPPADSLLIGTDRFRETRNRAIEIREDTTWPPAELDALASIIDFEAWARDGAGLAVRYVYRNGTLRSGTEAVGLVLPDDYLMQVQPVAERQAILAGYRLAQILSEIY